MANMLSIKPKRRGVAAAIGMLANTFRSGIFFSFLLSAREFDFLFAGARAHTQKHTAMHG